MAKIMWKQGEDKLQEAKRRKEQILSDLCGETITAGFYFEHEGKSYLISYDSEAQINLLDTFHLVDNGQVAEVNWTGERGKKKERLTLSAEQFKELYYNSVKHKLSVLSYYKDVLLPQVAQADNVGKVEAVKWNSKAKIAQVKMDI